MAQLPHPMQELLGERQSLEGADRFFREVLGEPLVRIQTQSGTHTAPARMVASGDAADDVLTRAVR